MAEHSSLTSSQRTGAYDDREFWQRAKDRNRGTADRLDHLGLPSFYAAEAFVTTYEMP